MPVHTVAPGDCFASIAELYGFSDPAALYEHADNAELKKKRPDLHTLLPGDQVVVPEKALKEVDCAAGKKHRFQVKLPKTKLHLVLKGPDGAALAGKKYKLVVDGAEFTGTTTGEGAVEHDIPAAATRGELRLKLRDDDEGDGFPIPLDIGHLDPHDELSGAQDRLANLGYPAGGERGTLGESTREALRAFQEKEGLEVTGELDDPTRDKLRSKHDG